MNAIMNKNTGKLLVAVLAMAMIIAGTAVVLSDSVNAVIEEGDVAQIGDEGYQTLDDAVSAAQPGDTIILLDDVTLTKSITVIGLNIDGADYTINTVSYQINFQGTDNSISNVTLNSSADVATIDVSGNAQVEINNCKFTGTSTTAVYVNFAESTKVTIIGSDISDDKMKEVILALGDNQSGNVSIENSTDVRVNIADATSASEITYGENLQITGSSVDRLKVDANTSMTIPSGERLAVNTVTGAGSLIVDEGGSFTAVTNEMTGDYTNDNPRTGLDQSIIAVENPDLSFSGEVYLAGDLVIPEDKTLTFRSGSTLDLSGKTLTVNGALVIESGAQVFGVGTETIVLGATGSIQNDGVIGYGSEVTVKAVSADADNYVTMMNVEGVSFGIETVYEGSTPIYTLTVSGDIYSTSGDFNTYTLDIVKSKIVGELNTDSEITVGAQGAIITNGAVFNMDGTATGDITMQNGSTLNITGDVNGLTVNAETGDFATADKTNDKNFAYGKSTVTFTDVTDIQLTVQSSTYTEDKKAMTEQVLYISGTVSYLGEKESGEIEIVNTDATGYSNPAVTKIAADTVLALDDGMKFIGGGIVVLGEIQTTGDGSNVTDYVGTEYTVTDAADRTKKTTYITTFELALADIATADKQTITVHGPVEVTTGFILADDQTIDINDATMTIGTDAKVELQNGATIDGTVQEVKGILYVYKGGVMRNEPVMYAVSGTNKTTGDKMYAGLEAAIANSQPGDVITVVAKGYENGVIVENNLEIPADRTVIIDTDKTVTFEKNLTIAEGATLTNKGIVNMSGDKAVVTVNGVFDNSATNMLNFVKATNGNVNIGGQYIVPITEDFTTVQYSVNGAYYNSEGKRIVTTFAKAVTATGAVEGDQPVKVIGKITESGEVTVDTDTVTIIGEASLGTVTVDNTDIVIDGTLTATVNGAYGADGSTSVASIVLTKATDMTVSNYSGVDDMNVTNWYNSISAVNGNVNIASGEVILTASGSASADENSVLKVSSGATLIVDAADNGTLTLTDAEYLTVEGTVIIESPVLFNANVAIDGTLDVRNDLTVSSNTKLTITGTLTVSADDENPATLTVEGRLNIGETPELVSATAAGTANGTITVSGGVIVVYNGASVADATIISGVTEQEPTAFVVNGYNYATVYGVANVNYLDDEIIDLKDIKGDSTDGHAPVDWYADGAKIETPANVAVGTYSEVSTTLAWEDVNVTVSVGPGLEVYIDDLKTEGMNIPLSVGDHTITVYIKPNYEGTPEITLNGQVISGGSFTLTADMIDGDNILYVTGASPADSTIVIDGGNDGESDGLGLTDYLLIILVILIVIMAIIVALRLMRS